MTRTERILDELSKVELQFGRLELLLLTLQGGTMPPAEEAVDRPGAYLQQMEYIEEWLGMLAKRLEKTVDALAETINDEKEKRPPPPTYGGKEIGLEPVDYPSAELVGAPLRRPTS